MILQLNPALPLHTPKGKGWAHFVLDYSQEHDLLYVVFLNDTGECWTFPNSDIHMDNNISLGRYDISNSGSSRRSGQHNRESDCVLGARYDGQTSGETTEGTT